MCATQQLAGYLYICPFVGASPRPLPFHIRAREARPTLVLLLVLLHVTREDVRMHLCIFPGPPVRFVRCDRRSTYVVIQLQEAGPLPPCGDSGAGKSDALCSHPPSSSGSSPAAVAGGVSGGLLALITLAIAVILYTRHRNRSRPTAPEHKQPPPLSICDRAVDATSTTPSQVRYHQ
jgi:hypothetical protein